VCSFDENAIHEGACTPGDMTLLVEYGDACCDMEQMMSLTPTCMTCLGAVDAAGDDVMSCFDSY
jgi:hypothetical protein